MFVWVGFNFDVILSIYVLGVVFLFMLVIMLIVLLVMMVWVVFYGWVVLCNEVFEIVFIFVWKVFKIGLVLVFVLQLGFYISNVLDIVNVLVMGVVSIFLFFGVDFVMISLFYVLFDKFNDDVSVQVVDIMKEVSVFRLDLLLVGGIFFIGIVFFFLYCFFCCYVG